MKYKQTFIIFIFIVVWSIIISPFIKSDYALYIVLRLMQLIVVIGTLYFATTGIKNKDEKVTK